MTTQRHRGLTEQAAQTAVDQACKMLRLPTIRNQSGDVADAAAREQMSYLGFLTELLLGECDDRDRRRSDRRIKAAAFPRDKSVRAFDFDANPNIDRPSSTPWPPANGSAKANPCVSSATAAPANPTC